MKSYINLFVAAVAALCMASCHVDQPDGSQYAVAPELELNVGVVQFTSEGGDVTVTAKTNSAVTATSNRSWLTAQASGNSVKLTAQGRDESLETRYAVVTISDGTYAKNLQVFQFGVTSAEIWQSSYDFDYAGGTLVLKHRQTGTPRVKVTGGEWISATPGEGSLTIEVTKNPYNASREGAVEWSCGTVSRTISIQQKANPSGSTVE